jgi:predicted protein tyrosine phosphatase
MVRTERKVVESRDPIIGLRDSAQVHSDFASVVKDVFAQAADIIREGALSKKFREHLKGKRVICLDIPDEFEFMDPALVRVLEAKVGPFFRAG